MAAKPIVNNYPIQIYTDYEYSYEVIMGSIRLYQPPDRSIHQTMDEQIVSDPTDPSGVKDGWTITCQNDH